MNKYLFIIILLLLNENGFAQSGPVTLNFARPNNSAGAFSTIKILINDQHIGDIENGSTFTYKLVFSGKGSIEVLVNTSIYTKTINIPVVSGGTYSFETGFADLGIFLLAVDNSAFEKQKLALSSQQQASSSTATTETKTNPESNPKSTSQLDVNRKDMSVSFKTEKEFESEAIRQQWLAKGGKLKGTSFLVGLSGMGQNTEMYDMAGVGFNLSFNQNFLNLQIPEHKEGPTSWNTYHFGYGLSGAYGIQTIDFPLAYNDYIDDIETTNLQFNINLNAGITFGLGKFIDKTNWRGLAVELNYKPTFAISIPGEGETSTDFNFAGFSIDFNKCNFTSTMNRIAPKAKFKLSIFVLPPIGDLPLFISLGLGAIWYNK